MALEGTLRDFSFADILQLISLQRKTGVLTLKNEGNVVTISFLDGRIVAASALNQRPEDRLGIILLKQGVLSETELEAALRKQEETLQRLGRILIDHSIVPAELVRRSLEQQILQIVFRVFRWTDGEYHFSQETDVDYDRDLMVPMAVDSIIMEGARMTDEWPFIVQRIPDHGVVFRKVDPGRSLQLVAEPDDLDALGFSFTETPEEPTRSPGDDRVTAAQMAVCELVNGRDSVDELVLRSNLLEFETFKALAELLDRGLIREATQEEVVGELSRDLEPVRRRTIQWASFPWLALPFLVLLGLSLSFVAQNPLNSQFAGDTGIWNRLVGETSSWFRLNRLARGVETRYFVDGAFPQTLEPLAPPALRGGGGLLDPWGRPYRMVTRSDRFLLAGADATGEPVPLLLIVRDLPWEGLSETSTGPGVILLD